MDTTLSYPSPMADKRGPGRPPGSRFPNRLMIYLSDRDLERLQTIAERRETTMADAVRQLIREEARRDGDDGGAE